jgi:ADP-ribose pyrophosphatase YjhB (NUDIX family)
MEDGTIEVVAALIRDQGGRVLLVRKRGTRAFMQPGGKRDPGEDDIAAISREVAEELGVAWFATRSGRSAPSTPRPRTNPDGACRRASMRSR